MLCLAARGFDSGAAAVVAQKAQQFNYLCQHEQLRGGLGDSERKDGGAKTGRRGGDSRGQTVDLETGSLGNKQGRGRGDRDEANVLRICAVSDEVVSDR